MRDNKPDAESVQRKGTAGGRMKRRRVSWGGAGGAISPPYEVRASAETPGQSVAESLAATVIESWVGRSRAEPLWGDGTAGAQRLRRGPTGAGDGGGVDG